MIWWYLGTVVGSFGLAVMLTPVVRRLALRWRAVDDPATDPSRKQHPRVTPLLGGVAIIFSAIIVWVVLLAAGKFSGTEFPAKYVVGLSIASLVIAIGGALDDRWRLRPLQQLAWPMLAVVIVGIAGIGVSFVTNPFGGLLYLDQWQWDIWKNKAGVAYQLTLWADLFTFVWLLGAMYTTKILDGLDGLVSGVGAIGAVIIFLLTQQPFVDQPAVGLIALSLAGAAGGFLVFNWSPASIFLGESGSLFIGFILGVLSIISGGKIATALLILGLPILDLAWVMIRRVTRQHTSPFTTADRSHLHFRLLDAGLSVRQSVLTLYTVMAVFGVSTLFVSGRMKLVTLAGNILALIALAAWVTIRSKRRQRTGGVV